MTRMTHELVLLNVDVVLVGGGKYARVPAGAVEQPWIAFVHSPTCFVA